jgi:excinuclease ABC subunit C
MFAELPEAVTSKLDALPTTPGCYLFKDREGLVVYIGKAKSLRSRVRSYFQAGSSDTRYFLPVLRAIIGDIETVVVGSEKEAAILENALIKEHRPRFNVKLRDDKEFLSLRLNKRADWPRLEVVRKAGEDGARYFGPYPSATSARRTLHLVNKHFQLRTCTDAELAARKRPCLQYQIKRCPAPCVYEVPRDEYAQQVETVALFLDGRHDELTRELETRMREAAGALRFELAGMLRDQLRAVSAVQESQRLVSDPSDNQDAIGLHREGDQVELAILFVRNGRIRDTCTFSLKKVQLPDEDVIGEFLRQFYEETATTGEALPDEILLPAVPEGVDGTAEWLSERRGRKLVVFQPKRGKKAHLVTLANENATHAFREKRRDEDDLLGRLAEVQEKLRLPTLPRRIECVDISHLGGNDTVGAVVALTDGRPDKKRYRVFHVRTVEGGDDYGAMREVLGRRFRRGLAAQTERDSQPKQPGGSDKTSHKTSDVDDPTKWDLPDLFVVDGGRGQLGVALAAAGDLGLSGLPIVGLAKERENVAGETLVDRVYLPGQKNGILLRRESAALYFLAQARDEAHRFSNRARERLGKKARFGSEISEIPGIGKGSEKALLTAFGSLKGILNASEEDLERVPGVSTRARAAIRALRLERAGFVPPVGGTADVSNSKHSTTSHHGEDP